ncbi:MAG: hypothetical protein GY847_04965 [Proteobacteria bacterium]|nr:hypothetical protein [Pseudomonadota bacterium]
MKLGKDNVDNNSEINNDLAIELETYYLEFINSNALDDLCQDTNSKEIQFYMLLKAVLDGTHSNALSLVYQCCFLRQLLQEERQRVFDKISSDGKPELSDWLATNYNLTLEQQVDAVSDLGDSNKRELINYIERRDSAVSYARALRIAVETMEHYANYYLELDIQIRRDILNKIVDDRNAFQVIFGFKKVAWLTSDLWNDDDLTLLKEILWVFAQIEGRIIQILDVPNGGILIYNEYDLKSIALKQNEFIAYTKEGLEHLIKISLNSENAVFFDLTEKTSENHDEFENVVNIVNAVLFNAPNEKFLEWDDGGNIWRSAGLGKRAWILKKYPLDAKALNTKDRPEPIRAQLRSELSNQDIFNQHIPVIVIDDESSESNLTDYLKVMEDLKSEFHEPLFFVTGAEKKSHIRAYSEFAANKFQRILNADDDSVLKNILNEKQINKRTGQEYHILKNEKIDIDGVELFVRDSPMYHISGIRNYTFLLFLSKGIKTMMNFDDDAPPETYCLLPGDRREVFSKRENAKNGLLERLIIEVNDLIGVSQQVNDEVSLYRLFANKREELTEIEKKYFGYAEDGNKGLIPQAMEEVVPLSGSKPCRFTNQGLVVSDDQSHFIDDKIKLTHQRYESIQLPLPDYNVAVTDFVYPEPRKEKKDNAFMTIPVNIMKGAELIGKKTADTNFMCLEGDLRGTMGVPAPPAKIQELQEKSITYVPYPFILDQDTSGLAQFVRYLQMSEKTCVNLQHTDRSALVAGNVHGFVADTYVIFNRSVYDITFSTPSIGQTLRFEEPPLIKWVRAPISRNKLTVCYSPVGGGQERAIGARFYMIPFQDFNEQVGGMARPFYEKAVADFYNLLESDERLKSASARDLHHELGKCYMKVAKNSRLTDENKEELRKQREYRALLLSRMALQKAEKETELKLTSDAKKKENLQREINDMDLILIRYADQFNFYHAKHIPNKERTNQDDDYSPFDESKDYFYMVSKKDNTLEWCKVVPSMKLGSREDVSNPVIISGQWRSLTKPKQFMIAGSQKEDRTGHFVFEFELGRKVILETLPQNANPIFIPAIPRDNESQYLNDIELQLFNQIKQDGESIYIWTDLVDAAESIDSRKS